MTARIGQPKTGGRKRGSVDREQRKILTDKMAADLMYCYAKLGGRSWLLEFARGNPGEFVRQGLSRLFPAPQKDDADVQLNQQVNIGTLSDFEVATRIAFALARGAQILEDQEPAIEAERLTPQEACKPRWQYPDDMPPPDYPAAVEDPERQQWASELSLTDEQRRDQTVVRQTHGGSLESYIGSSDEQGLRRAKLL